ncbi:uncharacterized protein LOC123565617 [Mercenaria mercenaria]|uniref:uncharacterized protein LOC123565617 n=1 Tax=Mercenaria mercenaria TaxID=6596 RepID=UPI00234E4B14|nr:uncharacterized protein LOC123565617 [Mercenaria mercenaria]
MSSGDEEDTGIVIDNGCGKIKAGFAGDDAPRCVIPNIVGSLESNTDYFIGDAAQSKRDVLTIKCPMSRGIIQNWDDMETIWNYIFHNQLHCSPAGKPVFVSEVPLNPGSNREGIAQIMFEKFNFSSLYTAPDPVFSMYAHGSVSGLVFSSGDAVTSVYSIFEGFPVPESVKRIDFGGLDVTELVSTCLSERGYHSLSPCAKDVFTVKDIKEKLCYVSKDYEKEKSKTVEEIAETYKLPDGQTVTLDEARFKCVEPMFQPSLFGLEHEAPATLIRKVIMNGDIDLRKSLCENIVLSGGNTKFPGFVERLKHELDVILPKSLNVNVRAPPERINTVWIGMSILASMSNYKAMWITKREYEENGPNIIHRNSV